jgi:hypothetical protein
MDRRERRSIPGDLIIFTAALGLHLTSIRRTPGTEQVEDKEQVCGMIPWIETKEQAKMIKKDDLKKLIGTS